MTVILVGAGFNADAKQEVGPISGHTGHHEIVCRYPLLADLPEICFGDEHVDRNSVEQRLAEAQGSGDPRPFELLADAIMKADYWLVPELITTSADNCYKAFFRKFGGCQFLTFNFDSLVELFLFPEQTWRPDDGYGVPVVADCPEQSRRSTPSKSLVLHLHGTFCLYVSDHEFVRGPRDSIPTYRPLDTPKYIFDADRTGALFEPYQRITPTEGYKPVHERVVVPVPDKAEGLRAKFVAAMYEQATSLLKSDGSVVAIGYSFNENDGLSYRPLLEALAGAHDHPHVLIVDPSATKIAERLRWEFPGISFRAEDKGFCKWVHAGFPGTLEPAKAQRR